MEHNIEEELSKYTFHDSQKGESQFRKTYGQTTFLPAVSNYKVSSPQSYKDGRDLILNSEDSPSK